MNSGSLILIIALIFVVYLASTGRLDSVWQVITGQKKV